MNLFEQIAILPASCTDGRISFEIWSDNGERVPCEVSREVLASIPSAFPARTTRLLDRFGLTRIRIEAAARRKLRSRPKALVGLLRVLIDDLDDLPLPPAPPTACRASPERLVA